MVFDPTLHHRHAMRLQGYDYSQEGVYFITIVTRNRVCYFGDIVDGVMQINELGDEAEQCWLELASRFSGIELDEFVIMPNHFHAILAIVEGGHTFLSEVVRTFKALTTRRIHLWGVNEFSWQRSFHDPIIRSEAHLKVTREYTINNPARWAEDEENPFSPSPRAR